METRREQQRFVADGRDQVRVHVPRRIAAQLHDVVGVAHEAARVVVVVGLGRGPQGKPFAETLIVQK